MLELSEKSNEIVAEFAKHSASDLAKVYKIKEDKAMEEFSRWQDIKNNTAKSYKALDLFNGLMYRNIDRDNFDEADKEYIEKNVFITTSLYGIIGAYDLIQEHRLDFLQNVKISGESLKNFWRASYDESIKDEKLNNKIILEYEYLIVLLTYIIFFVIVLWLIWMVLFFIFEKVVEIKYISKRELFEFRDLLQDIIIMKNSNDENQNADTVLTIENNNEE